MEMGFLDIFKNLFKKKEPQPTSPSESQTAQSIPPADGQFMNPQNPANSQGQTPPEQTPQK